jgi:hypothetical protein
MALENLIGMEGTFDSGGFQYPQGSDTIFPPTEMEKSIQQVSEPRPIQSENKKSVLTKDDYYSDVQKMIDTGMPESEALQGTIEYYVKNGITVQGFEDQFTQEAVRATQIQKTPQIEEDTDIRDTIT